MLEKPEVGVSRCLLGDPVRYDGDSKADRIVIDRLGTLFELVPVCPEVEAGLSIPRPPVQLTHSIQHPRMTGRDDPTLDVTDMMQVFCRSRPAGLDHLCGFVFKSRSPSCGLHSTPVFIDNDCVSENNRGLFARALTQRYPDMPVIEETDLESTDRYDSFVENVFVYTARNRPLP